jgi:ribonuclease BN (tRNA processing enzyme)/GAF domain-containing protein
MHVRFFGTRGSIATPGPQTLRYGGNTSCVEVTTKSGTLIVLDMGTGAAVLGRELVARGEALRGHILISHTHWDHIQGLPFFTPLFVAGSEWDIYAPRGFGQTLRDTLAGQMQYTYFPVSLEQLGATIRYHELVEGWLQIGDVEVTARYLNHPGLTLGYRLQADGVSLVYACDHEPHSPILATAPNDISGEDRRHAEFLADADLVIHDAQYLASEYPLKAGWGHSTVDYAMAVARLAGVRQLALTHHDPKRDDDTIDDIVGSLPRTETHVFAAAEGRGLELRPRAFIAAPKPSFQLQASTAPAMVGRSALLVSSSPRMAALSDLLRSDEVHVIKCSIGDAARMVAQEKPLLVLVEDTGDDQALEASRAIRRLPDAAQGLPIVLVTANEHRARAIDDAFTDILLEPYSETYARTRVRAWLMRAACRWVRAPNPSDEDRRLAAIRGLGLWGTPPEERFDRITRLAAAVFSVPISLIALMERDREWFKSCCGVDIREVPRDASFCGHAIFERRPLVVADAREDERFADNPHVTGAPGVRFYAGYPLILGDGSCVGTLCILDTKPRDIDDAGISMLGDLAQFAVRELDSQNAGRHSNAKM